MSRKFSRWLRSKDGKRTLMGIVAVLLVVVVTGQLLGWWASLGELITGTAGPPPPPHYDPPQGGYTCLPTCVENDGKFLLISGEDMATFAGAKVVVWVSVPGDYASFEIGIFDGDSGKDNDGNIIGWAGGNWDDSTTETTYTLYADPLRDGSGSTTVAVWRGNQDMPNNDWYNVTVNNVAEAKGPSRHYFYRLEVTRPVEGRGGNAFKLRSNGYLGTGQADLVDANFAIVGNIVNLNDISILYPHFQDWSNPGPSNYTGDWQFYFYVPNDTVTLEFWDGDFDRGTSAGDAPDTDDPNTVGIPPWADPSVTVNERAGGKGAPADDSWWNIARREPPVRYELIDPVGDPLYVNEEPSGTEEWEWFSLSTDPNVDADLHVNEIKPGFYTWHIEGLDMHNLVFIRLNYDMCDPEDGCGPPEWPEGNCPRTIGYWKNNVKKVLIQGKTGGVQESRDSLEWGLRNIALASPLFRSGINVTAPQPIAAANRLTDQEANDILQKANGNSMLDRALQQNLAAWLNLGTGKVGPTTWVVLNVHGGTFEGTLWDALQEAQDIILNGGDLERAKDIADQINNGLMGEEAEDSTCEDYHAVIPPDKQPPAYDDMPEAPKPPAPPNPTPAATPDPATCGARVNTYGVENPTNAPFYGIKFEYQSGAEVKNGDFDEFKFVLTEEQAAAMATVQMEAKAGQNVGQVTLEGCDFTSELPCGGEPIQDENHYFAFYFMGAKDNGDGTLTLTFYVQNFTDSGLSHTTIGLPDGAVPSSPTGSYQSEVCP